MKLKKWITTLTLAAAAVGVAGAAQAQQFFRIGTGGRRTYYPVGGIIANAVSQPGKLIATAVASNGSVANINGILGGSFEAGFTQSDVAFWAYSGTGTFDEQAQGPGPAPDRHAIPGEHPPGGAQGLGHQERGRPEGQARVDGRARLGHAGRRAPDPGRLRHDRQGHQGRIPEAQPGRRQAQDGGLDAFFFVGGAPARHRRAGLQRRGHRDRVDGRPEIDALRAKQEFFTPDTIAANTYQNVGEVKTISVNAQLVSSAKVPEAVVYEVTKALYSDATRKTLDNGHAKGKLITRDNAIKGAGIPFHPGAEKFYKEIGLLK